MRRYKTFAEFRDAVLDRYLAFYPTFSANLGLHQFDSRTEDWSATSRTAYVNDMQEALLTLERDFAESLPNRIDEIERKMMKWKINEEIFRMTEYKEFEWNPMLYDGQLELLHLFHRDYAPLEERVRAAAVRLRAVPSVLAVARQNLTKNIDRTILETALTVLEGRVHFFEELPSSHLGPLKGKPIYDEITTALREATIALQQFIDALKTVVLPDAKYDSFRLGEGLMKSFLQKTELITDSLDDLLARGKKEIETLRARFANVAHSIDSEIDPVEVYRSYVENDHFSEESIIPETERMLERIRTFLLEKKIISIPSEVRCLVRPTPENMRWAFAAMDSPGAFERVATEAYYYVTPPDPGWDDAKKKDFLRGLNRAVMEIVSIHEAYPGHYVHFLHLQRATSKVGKTFQSYSFIEGWAHYTEEMMVEEGWGNGDARLELAFIHEALIRLCRYVSSIELHRGTMTLAESQNLFETSAFMRPVSARKEAERGVFDPGYLYYTLGKFQIRDIRNKMKSRPGFSLEHFHDEFLSFGTAPLPIIADVMREAP